MSENELFPYGDRDGTRGRGRSCDASGLRADIVALDPAKCKVLEMRSPGSANALREHMNEPFIALTGAFPLDLKVPAPLDLFSLRAPPAEPIDS